MVEEKEIYSILPKMKLEICWISFDTSVSNACSTKSQCDNCIESSLVKQSDGFFHLDHRISTWGRIYSVDIVPTCQSSM